MCFHLPVKYGLQMFSTMHNVVLIYLHPLEKYVFNHLMVFVCRNNDEENIHASAPTAPRTIDFTSSSNK